MPENAPTADVPAAETVRPDHASSGRLGTADIVVTRHCERRQSVGAKPVALLYGNSTKLISWAFYLVSPRLRISIPHTSGPLWARPHKHKIPKTIWQTNYTDRVTIAVYFNYLCNRWLSPTYSYRFMDTAERAQFISEHFPRHVAEAYAKLQIGAAQADLWRLLVLYRFGGVYLDIDAHVAWPLGLAIDPDLDELYILHRGGKLSNYFMASVQENPNLALAIDAVLKNIEHPTTNNIFELTGPAVLHDVLGNLSVPTVPYEITCYQGSFTNEFFQYVDHPQGKWVRVQDEVRAIKC